MPNQDAAADKTFFRQVRRISKTFEIVLMEGFNSPDILWKKNRAKHKI